MIVRATRRVARRDESISDSGRAAAGTTTGVRVNSATLRPAAPLRRIVHAAVVLAVLSGTLVMNAQPAQAQSAGSELAPDVISVQGRGFGHGNGLSQWGALGYAVDHGWTSEQIVAHYYGGTQLQTIDERDVWVHLTRKASSHALLVTSDSRFTVADHRFDGGDVARVDVSNGDFSVRSTSGCGSRGSLVADGLSASSRRGDNYVEALSDNSDFSVDDQSQLLVMIYCDAGDESVESMRVAYRGAVGVVDQGGPVAFNRVPLEQYVRGVVPRESIPEWGSAGNGRGIAALEAQAIAARSYVLSLAVVRERGGRFTDTCDYWNCQVYAGAAKNGQGLDHGSRYVHTNTAIVNTAGQVLVQSNGSIAFTEFHASSGGWTAGRDEGSHFPGVEDLGDSTSGNPNHVWERKIRRSDIETSFPRIGKLRCIEVTHRNGDGAWGGRTRGLRLIGTDGVEDFEGYSGVEDGRWGRWARDPFRKAFALRSDWYRFPQFASDVSCEHSEPAPPIEPSAEGPGLWILKSDGTVLADGSAEHLGNGSGSGRFVAMAAESSGRGYWLATADGDVQAFGDADEHGTAAQVDLTQDVVAMAAHPSGAGYWLATADGSVFAFGAAGFWGAVAHISLASHITDIESTPTGDGYWLLVADGRVLAFGDAHDSGCAPVLTQAQAGVSLASQPDGRGYRIAGSDTAVHAIGSADGFGSRAGRANRLKSVAIAATSTGDGYWLVWSDGTSFNYGNAPDYATSRAGNGVVAAEPVP